MQRLSDGFKVSKDLTLPIEAATWTFADLAIKGAGKTYGACVFAEEMIKAGIPIIAIDPMGIWWGLRVGVNEKGELDPSKPGLPIVVFGGQHADLPIPVTADKRKFGKVALDEDRLCLMVKAVLESRINAVVDLTGFSKSMKHRIVAIFISELMRLYEINASVYGTRHVFLEEANRYCPQREVKGDVAVSTGAIESLVMQGGNYNLGCTLITQRSAALNKNVLSQGSCIVVLRILHQLDKNAVKAWVESMADPKDPKIAKWYDGLRDLKNGEAWIWHPESKLFQKIKFRKRETLHATREYFRRTMTQQVKMMDVTEFVEKFRSVFEPKPKPQPMPTASEIKQMSQVLSKGSIAIPPGSPLNQELPFVLIREKPTVVTVKLLPTHTGSPEVGTEQTFIHQVPNVTLIKERPTIQVPTEPSSPIGKVLVVLMNNKLNDWRWTGKKIKNLIRAHEWLEDGADEAIAELTRWEILVVQSNHYLHFQRARVHVVEHETVREVN